MFCEFKRLFIIRFITSRLQEQYLYNINCNIMKIKTDLAIDYFNMINYREIYLKYTSKRRLDASDCVELSIVCA